MPTYAQLQAESWWGREIVTPELKQFEQWIRDHFGLTADAIGDKGNNVHLNGSHRSDEWITNSQYCTNRSYTHQAGLTADQKRHIAGCDITPKTTADMLLISQRIDAATRAGQLEEIVYWYGNVNGDTRVDGYDNIRNVAATSDSSHLWHLHLSFDRRVLSDINVMRRVYAVLTGTEVDDMTEEQWQTLQRVNLTLGWLVQGKDVTGKQPGLGDQTFPIQPNTWLKQLVATAQAGGTDPAAVAALVVEQLGPLLPTLADIEGIVDAKVKAAINGTHLNVT